MESYMFPDEIVKYTSDMSVDENEIGHSKAKIYNFKKASYELYLKVEQKNSEFEQEQMVMEWLQDKLPVPRIISKCNHEGYDYLLMTKVDGNMSCATSSLSNPESLIKALADGINKLQSIDISDCPFNCSLDEKLKSAWKRIKNNEIDMSDWEEDTEFTSPEELYDYLLTNKPKEEVVFSHGDYCLPNVFIHNKKITGLIDLGRAGIADRWQDIALCVRSIEHNLGSRRYTNLLFKYLNLEPDYEKIKYYILLDELF